MYYFAYGSNMSSKRLLKRINDAEKIALAELPQYQLKFHKESIDGSSKCDAFFTGSNLHKVVGIVWQIDDSTIDSLDEFEGVGKGYERETIVVIDEAGNEIEAHTYIATRIKEDLKPYHWYKAHVLAGAREHKLPDAYVRKLEHTESQMDEDAERVDRELAIYN